MPERPVIIVVDDEPDVLSCLLDALIRRFGGDYRVISYLSAKASLEAICKFKDANEDVALVIADQWMPEMTGRDFLGRARTIVPTAKRALMVGWGDRDASPTILQACALGELDNYLYKPWSPAEIHLYPFISEFWRNGPESIARAWNLSVSWGTKSLRARMKFVNSSIVTAFRLDSTRPALIWQID